MCREGLGKDQTDRLIDAMDRLISALSRAEERHNPESQCESAYTRWAVRGKSIIAIENGEQTEPMRYGSMNVRAGRVDRLEMLFNHIFSIDRPPKVWHVDDRQHVPREGVMRGKFFSYLRVSTDRQGERGHGLDAQRKAVTDYLNGGAWELLGEFVEVESGKRDDRPELEKALAACKKHRARLVIAKLDRLSRDVAFIANLMKRVDFVCCDRPHAKPFELHIYASLAQEERRLISERTIAGLAAAKAKGVVLGNRELAAANKADAIERAKALAPILADMAGMSARAAAVELNSRRVKTPTGAPWSAKTVIRVRERLMA